MLKVGGGGGVQNYRFNYYEELLEIVTKYKYLETLQRNSSFEEIYCRPGNKTSFHLIKKARNMHLSTVIRQTIYCSQYYNMTVRSGVLGI